MIKAKFRYSCQSIEIFFSNKSSKFYQLSGMQRIRARVFVGRKVSSFKTIEIVCIHGSKLQSFQAHAT